MSTPNRVALLAAALAFAAGIESPLAAPSTMDLSKPPLFLNASVDPNLFVTFDDSGSMDDGMTPDDVRDLPCEWRLPQYYSAAYNKQYYDPNLVYEPPLDASGKSLADSSYTAAPLNGFDAASATINLDTQYFASYEETATPDRIVFDEDREWIAGGCSVRAFNFPSGGPKAFYAVLKAGGDPTVAADYEWKTVADEEKTNFANWFSYYRIRGLALKSAVSRAFGVMDDDLRVAWQNLHKSPIESGTTIDRFSGTRRTGFFEWLFTSPYSGNTPTLDATIRVNEFFARSGEATTNPYWDATLGRELSCRQNFHVLVSDGYWNQDPNHPSSTAAKSILSNHTLPDGREYVANSSGDGKHAAYIWNEAARGTDCNTPDKSCSPSYTDLAFDAWRRDLRDDLTNNVPPYLPDRSTGVTGSAVDLGTVENLLDVPEIYWNPSNDPATWQHVVQFFIGFGISGKIPYSAATLESIRKGVTAWSGARNNDPESVDDSWHATLASRGQYFGATDPNQIVDALIDILSSIVQRKGTASAVSVSTGIVASDTLSYQTLFDSTDWSGTVLARKVDASLGFGDVEWDAGCVLTGGTCATTSESGLGATPDWNSGRVILSSRAGSGTGNGIAFRWSSLAAAQQALLNVNPSTGKTDSAGSSRLDWLRGDRSKERRNGGTFRNRNSLLGAVVHSGVVTVSAPAERFDDTAWPAGSDEAKAAASGEGYDKFKKDLAARPETLYFGANDGMLHAIDAKTGEERFAYVPFGVYRNLGKLTNPTYQFEPTVDNSPVVRDAFVGGKWRTLLIGTLRRGGQGAFALDITDPEPTESKAAEVVLWEFNDGASGAADLGYTYGTPFVTRLPHGRWVVLLPAGYYANEADAATGSGNAVLFVLDAENGTVVKKFDLGTIDADAAGLAAPIAVDLDADDVTEYAYAGDLAGNIWRFDLRGKNASSWTASRLFKPETAFERPITTQPRVLRDPTTRLPMVFVGTGKFIERDDRSSDIEIQAFYGIRDDGTEVGPDNLATRTLVDAGEGIREVSDAEEPDGTDKGWQILLDDEDQPGERVVAPAALRAVANRVVFSTVIPNGDDPCTPGGSSFLMFVDGATGGPPTDGVAAFDVNDDGEIDGSDNADAVGTLVGSLVPGVASIIPPGGGIGGIVLPPAGGGGGGAEPPTTIKTREFEWRRRSWRELFLRTPAE